MVVLTTPKVSTIGSVIINFSWSYSCLFFLSYFQMRGLDWMRRLNLRLVGMGSNYAIRRADCRVMVVMATLLFLLRLIQPRIIEKVSS
jgi:hypothetical protein